MFWTFFYPQTSKLSKQISEDDDQKQDDNAESKTETCDIGSTDSKAGGGDHDHNGNEFDLKGNRMFGVKRKKHPMLGVGEKKGSAIDLDIGPPLDSTQTKNYRTIQQILIR